MIICSNLLPAEQMYILHLLKTSFGADTYVRTVCLNNRGFFCLLLKNAKQTSNKNAENRDSDISMFEKHL